KVGEKELHNENNHSIGGQREAPHQAHKRTGSFWFYYTVYHQCAQLRRSLRTSCCTTENPGRPGVDTNPSRLAWIIVPIRLCACDIAAGSLGRQEYTQEYCRTLRRNLECGDYSGRLHT